MSAMGKLAGWCSGYAARELGRTQAYVNWLKQASGEGREGGRMRRWASGPMQRV